MEAVFLKLLNMSITASWLVLAVFLLRVIFQKAPKSISLFLWALVAIRLVCPVSFQSVLSLIPNPEPVPTEILTAEHPVIQSGIPAVNEAVNPALSEALTPTADAGAPVQSLVYYAAMLWLFGVGVLLLYTAVSYWRVQRKVREAAPYQKNIWLCDRIDTPFILGVLRPRVFLPSDLEKADMPYVLAHEQAHLKRGDHLWKPFGFLLLTVYWFNPVLWVAYILFCKDLELACDERVIRALGAGCKKPYSNALIHCSTPRKRVSACPLAFGETGVKERVRSVLNYKKPAFWLAAVTVVAVAVVGIFFLTNPKAEKAQNLADLAQAKPLFENVQTSKLVEDQEETSFSAAQTQALLTALQGTQISVDPVSAFSPQEKAVKLVLLYEDAGEAAIYFDSAYSKIRLEDGSVYKVMDSGGAKHIFEAMSTATEAGTADEDQPLAASLPEYQPGSVKLEPQDSDDYAFERKYRLAYYMIWGSFTDCLTEAEAEDYMQWIDAYNKSTGFGETQEEMLLVTYIRRYNISRAEFDAAAEKMRAQLPTEDGVTYEASEIPNGDIIYTFDNEVINRYYRYA